MIAALTTPLIMLTYNVIIYDSRIDTPLIMLTYNVIIYDSRIDNTADNVDL